MPGLIDAHWHAFMATTPQILLMTADSSYLHLLAARQAEATLMRGFTTIRDLTIPDLPAPPGTGRFNLNPAVEGLR
jgi:imidazolonepropionase-like amidohydrolase